MLQSPTGATIAAMMKATGWQQHSVRGFLAGVVRKRLKLKLGSKKVDGNRVYQIASGDSGKTGSRRSKASRPERHAARQDRSGTAGPEEHSTSRSRACAISTSVSFGPVGTPYFGRQPPPHLPRHLLFRVLAYRLQADHLGDLDGESQRLLDRSGSPEKAGQRAVDLSRRTAEPQARHRAGPRMERADATGGGAGRWLCLERQDLSEPVEGCLRDHRHPLERTEVLRPARQAIERTLTHEDRIDQVGSLRDLYPRLDRPGARAGLQLARRPV